MRSSVTLNSYLTSDACRSYTLPGILATHPGIDVNAWNEDGLTAMYIAAAHGHVAVVEVLADEGHALVSKRTPAQAPQRLVESWIETPVSAAIAATPQGGLTPLHIAARNGKADTVRALLQRGAGVNELTTKNLTALIAACIDNRTSIMRMMLPTLCCAWCGV